MEISYGKRIHLLVKNGKKMNKLIIEQINQLKIVTDGIKRKKTFWGMGNTAVYKKKINCMKAFGDVRFCECLCENLPVFLTFEEYISIITSTLTYDNFTDMNVKDKLRFINTNLGIEDSSKLISNAINARDKCVKEILNVD